MSLEAEILAHAFRGDKAAVITAVNSMTLTERRAFREALALTVSGAGHDCLGCDRVIPCDERSVAVAQPLGRYHHYHEGCAPAPGAGRK